jgi:hypothetical protein
VLFYRLARGTTPLAFLDCFVHCKPRRVRPSVASHPVRRADARAPHTRTRTCMHLAHACGRTATELTHTHTNPRARTHATHAHTRARTHARTGCDARTHAQAATDDPLPPPLDRTYVLFMTSRK